MGKLLGGLLTFGAGFLFLRRAGSEWSHHGGAQLVEKYLGSSGLAFLVALAATALMHSSSAFLALLVALAESGRIPTVAALGAILGANVGTTATAQLAALPTPNFSFIVLGILLALLGRGYREIVWHFHYRGKSHRGHSGSAATVGEILLGLGLILTGLQFLEQTASFARWPQLTRALSLAEGGAIPGVLAGCLASALVQSSTLLIGVLMGLVASGKVGIEAAVAVIVGANVGTTLDVLVFAIGAKPRARRVAWGHLFLNIVGAILFMVYPQFLVRLVKRQSPRQAVAWAHTLFNLSGILFWPFLPLLAKFLERLIPDGKGKEQQR